MIAKSELNRIIRLAYDALLTVQQNQAYQKSSGGKYFTSAPTEYEWKRDSQLKTDAAVTKAIVELGGIL